MHSKSDKSDKNDKHSDRKPPKRHVTPRRVRESEAIDEYDAAEPALPIGAMLEIGDWILDLARAAALDDTEDLATVERVRSFVHSKVRGLRARPPSESELLTALALAVAAMEKRHGVVGLGELVAQGLDPVVRITPHSRRAPARYCFTRRSPRLAPHPYCEP
jgi:hypothetical protein